LHSTLFCAFVKEATEAAGSISKLSAAQQPGISTCKKMRKLVLKSAARESVSAETSGPGSAQACLILQNQQRFAASLAASNPMLWSPMLATAVLAAAAAAATAAALTLPVPAVIQ